MLSTVSKRGWHKRTLAPVGELEGHVEFGPLQMVGCLDCTGPYGEVGDFSLATMYSHFQFGGNEPLTISMSSIDFSGTSQSELGIRGMKQGQTRPVNLFNAGVLNKTALAFGRVNMMYHGNNQFSIVGDGSARFDFSPLIDSRASLGRNAGNILGAAINYNLWLGPVWAGIPLIYGGGYNVNFTGTTFISE